MQIQGCVCFLKDIYHFQFYPFTQVEESKSHLLIASKLKLDICDKE